MASKQNFLVCWGSPGRMSSLQLKVNTCQDKQHPHNGWYWAWYFHQQNAHRVGMASRKEQYLLEEKLLPLGTGTADQGALHQLSHSMWNKTVLCSQPCWSAWVLEQPWMSLQCRHTARIKWAADQLQPFPASKKARELQQLRVNTGSEQQSLHGQPAVTLRNCPTLLGQEPRSHSFPPHPQECRKGKHLGVASWCSLLLTCNELSVLSGEMEEGLDRTEEEF